MPPFLWEKPESPFPFFAKILKTQTFLYKEGRVVTPTIKESITSQKFGPSLTLKSMPRSGCSALHGVNPNYILYYTSSIQQPRIDVFCIC